MRPLVSLRLLGLTLVVLGVVGGCASGSTAPPPGAPAPASASAATTTTSAPRPASTAKLTVVSPTPNEVVTGSAVHVDIQVTGATIVMVTSSDIRPDQGHIHLYIDNNLVSMNYGTAVDIPAVPGTHVLRAEFVASDHAPFDPRDVTPDIVFTVKP
jgi:hypothetical protein